MKPAAKSCRTERNDKIMDQVLNQKIDAYIAQNKEQLLKDIAALVAALSTQ